MNISELTVDDLIEYLKIDSDDIDNTEGFMLASFLDAAKNYAANYTGRTLKQLDGHADVAVAILCLAGDFYTNRDMYTQLKGTGNSTSNKTVTSILDMYCINLLPEENSLLAEA